MIDNGLCDHMFKVSCIWLKTEKGGIFLLDLSWIMFIDLIFNVSNIVQDFVISGLLVNLIKDVTIVWKVY